MFLHEYGEKWLDVDGMGTRYFGAGTGDQFFAHSHSNE